MRALMHPMGDEPASCDTREALSTRTTIRNRVLGAINLPAMIHASYDAREL